MLDFLSEIAIIIASDDPKWCQNNLHHPNWNHLHFTDQHSTSLDPINFDFSVISHCDHSVMLYGTFAFWMTFFAGGHVFVPLDYRKAKQRAPLGYQIHLANNSRYHYLKWD